MHKSWQSLHIMKEKVQDKGEYQTLIVDCNSIGICELFI